MIVQIEQYLIGVLEGVTPANGYFVECFVQRREVDGNDVEPGTIYVEYAETEDNTEAAPLGHDAHIQVFNITVFAAMPQGTRSVDHALMEYEAAIRKAVHGSYTMGGRVYNYSWGDCVTDTDTGLPSRVMPLRVHYRTLQGDPYNQ